MATTAVDLLVVAFRALSSDEQDAAIERLRELRVEQQSGLESEAARFIRSLRAVADHVGHPDRGELTVGAYKQASAELIAAGHDVETFSRVYRHYGSWPRAREALDLSDSATPRRIEARFRYRRLGKVWRFSETALRRALHDCADYYAQLEERDEPRGVSVAEFDHWRQRELELAHARGDHDFFLPSASPYRRRYRSWEGALLHFGFTPEQAAARFSIRERPARPEPFMPSGLPVATLQRPAGQRGCLPLPEAAVERLIAAYEALPARSRYVLTVRLGLGGAEPLELRRAAEPLGLHLDRVRQLQLLATESLIQAAAGEGRDRPAADTLREPVLQTLRTLAETLSATA
jgi:hypothetical protein